MSKLQQPGGKKMNNVHNVHCPPSHEHLVNVHLMYIVQLVQRISSNLAPARTPGRCPVEHF